MLSKIQRIKYDGTLKGYNALIAALYPHAYTQFLDKNGKKTNIFTGTFEIIEEKDVTMVYRPGDYYEVEAK